MTTFDASLKLFTWFSENDYFHYPKDTQKLLLIIDKEEDYLPVNAALTKFQEEGVLSVSEKKSGDKIYFLNKKLNQIEQDIKIHGDLSLVISQKINWFCENVAKEESDFCDPSNIKIKDIWNMVHIIDFFQKKCVDSQECLQ
jgi:hypothetical protein